jgi:hypothetical protein
MRGLHRGTPLLGLLPNGKQRDDGVLPAEQVFRIDGTKSRELYQLLGRAVHVRPRIQHDYGLARCGEEVLMAGRVSP